MKIRDIQAFPLEYPEPHYKGIIRYVTLVRVRTDDGLVGWGESISQFLESALATKTIIERGFSSLLLDEDPHDVEKLWYKMLQHIWWYGPQGIAAFALSAVDMALWDLKGKAMGLPVCKLLGGQLKEKVLAMASIIFDMEDIDWTVEEFRWLSQQGYHYVFGGYGMHARAAIGQDHNRDMVLARLIREAIGDHLELVFDMHGASGIWDLPTAIRCIRDFEPFRLKWIEEPLPPHDLDAYARLRMAVSTPIGTGEQEWNTEGYRRLMHSGGVSVVQMDPGRALGITGCRKVVQLVEANNLQWSAHSWSSAINSAASVHLLASSTCGVMNLKPHESPMQHELVSDPWIQKDGYLMVRDIPGLGVNVLEDAVHYYEVG